MADAFSGLGLDDFGPEPEISRQMADYLIALAVEKGISPGYGRRLEDWIDLELGITVDEVGELTREEYERVREALEEL